MIPHILRDRRKRGSLSLSINAIVVVVLAFVMLGLGLTLTRTIFKDVGSTAGSINEQIRQQILEDLRQGNKQLSFPQQKVVVDFRGQQTIAFGFKNVGSTSETFCILMEAESKTANSPEPNMLFVHDTDPQVLSAGSDSVMPVTIESQNTQKELYKGKIMIYTLGGASGSCSYSSITNVPADQVYAQKSFFITVQ